MNRSPKILAPLALLLLASSALAGDQTVVHVDYAPECEAPRYDLAKAIKAALKDRGDAEARFTVTSEVETSEMGDMGVQINYGCALTVTLQDSEWKLVKHSEHTKRTMKKAPRDAELATLLPQSGAHPGHIWSSVAVSEDVPLFTSYRIESLDLVKKTEAQCVLYKGEDSYEALAHFKSKNGVLYAGSDSLEVIAHLDIASTLVKKGEHSSEVLAHLKGGTVAYEGEYAHTAIAHLNPQGTVAYASDAGYDAIAHAKPATPCTSEQLLLGTAALVR